MGRACAGRKPAIPPRGRRRPPAWTPGDAPDVNMGEPGCPTPPPGGRVGAGLALAQGCGATGFVPRLRPQEGVGGPGPHAGGWGNRVVPAPARGRGWAGDGATGLSHPPPGGRVWAGLARTQGDGGNRVVPRPRPREGVGGPGPCAGGWGNRVVPRPRPREGLGGLRPSKKNLCSFLFVCGGAAWRAEVTIARSVLPPSQPPPAGGRRRVPAPAGGGSGRGPSPRPRSRGAGGTPALPGRLHRAVCAIRMTVSRDHGGTRFSHPPARGRVWAGAALTQGAGESRFPHTPTRWEGLGAPRPSRNNRSPPRKYLRGS